MLFFTVLIGACVAIQSGVLKPVDLKTPAVSLIQTAKTDPHALIQMLEGADKDTLKQIIKLLRELDDEARVQQGTLVKSLALANKNFALAQKEQKRLAELEVQNKTVFKQREQEYNTANGKYTETKREHDTGSPRLTKEIDVFNRVLGILRNLLNNQPQDKELVELGESTEGQAYQRMIQNLQADPEKLKKIISIVESLHEQSETELKTLKDKMDDAKKVLDNKNRAKMMAHALWTQVKDQLEDATSHLQVQVGRLTEAKIEHNTQYPILTSERVTLGDVLKILANMLKAQD